MPKSSTGPTQNAPQGTFVLSGRYESKKTLDSIKSGDVDDLAPATLLNGTSTRDVQMSDAVTVANALNAKVGERLGQLSKEEIDDLLEKIPALGSVESIEKYNRRAAEFLRGLARFGVDPFSQPISGALMTVGRAFWIEPPYACNRQNVVYTDDHNAVETRRAADLPCSVAIVEEAVAQQDRHPGGVPTCADLRWHTRAYVRAQMLGLAQRAMLDVPEYRDLLRAHMSRVGVADKLWVRGRKVLRDYAAFARSFSDTVLGVMADGQHPLFLFFSALGFCDFAPEGLAEAVNKLSDCFPSDADSPSPVELALKTLVEDMLEYVSEEYREFWGELTRLAAELKASN